MQSPVSIADALRFHAARTPHRTALVAGLQEYTCGDLSAASSESARLLRAEGVRPGDRVAYLGRNSPELIVAAAAAIQLRAVFTPLNWRLAAPEIEDILKNAEASIIVVDPEFSHLLGRATGPALRVLPSGHFKCAAAVAKESPAVEHGAASRGDVALQIYTSGTTGKPKGVMLTNGNLHFVTGGGREDWPEWLRWNATDTCLLTTPLFHIGGFSTLVRALFAGAKLVIETGFDAGSSLKLLDAHRVTVTALVPATLKMILNDPLFRTVDLSSLKCVYYGSAPIEASLLRLAIAQLKCNFVQCYGQTETTGTICALAPEDHTTDPVTRMKSAGKPLPGVRIKIVDIHAEEVLPETHGEIVVLSDSNMAGYFNAIDDSKVDAETERWIRTGDGGYLDGAGYLYVTDRLKDMIISGGENIYPSEIERVLFDFPAIAEAAVIGVSSAKWGEEAKAIVVARDGCAIEPTAILAWLKGRIAGYKIPKSLETVDALPRNHLGKIDRNALRRTYSKAADERNPR